MGNFKIFITEDDAQFGKMLKRYLSLNPDYEVSHFVNGKDTIQNMYQRPSVVLLDYNLPDMTGLEVMNSIHKNNPSLPVIIMSGQRDIEVAVELLKKGAYDYIIKSPDINDRIWKIILNIKNHSALEEKVEELQKEVTEKYSFSKSIIGDSAALKNVFHLMEKAVKTNISASVFGETGTGKELVAKAIHYGSARATAPFVTVNVSSIPNTLIESEMFGYMKGAFTGADNNKPGRFEEANHGTLFLDEIAEMNKEMQAKLLRVLQEMEVTRLGSNKPVKIDVRIIIATHKNLENEVQNGNFREDLYYRLLGLNIELPPLRERDKDVLILAKHFAKEFCIKNKMKVAVISKDAFQKLNQYHFPGNIRELKAIVELACVMCENNLIEENDITFRSKNPMNDFLTKEMTLQNYINEIVFFYLKKYNDNIKLVAEKLDMGVSTIYKILKQTDTSK